MNKGLRWLKPYVYGGSREGKGEDKGKNGSKVSPLGDWAADAISKGEV